MTVEAMRVPEEGQVVQVRSRTYIVQDVQAGAVEPASEVQHRVRLEALDDDQLGQTLDVIWEHEVGPLVHDTLALPRPEAWDPLNRFEAFLLASRWSVASVLGGLPLQAPFRGAIQIEDYQLEPVVRALRMPRVNLLIADDVGLGKTIEAGMVMQELLARQRIRRILILCPASLQRQWADEMAQKFALRFEIVDRDYLDRLRREYGVHVNPWASYPRLITSMDFLKRERPLQQFMASLKQERSHGLRDWDLLLIDEAHNVAPTGRTKYIRDSDRTHMVRQVMPHFDHRLFLTATPHNGYTESFTAMLEMLDPLRFSRGPDFDRAQLETVMVRRLKDDLVDELGRRRFPRRQVDALPVRLSPAERTLFDDLDRYLELRLARAVARRDLMPVAFTLTLLKKRLLSSPLAFKHSIDVHHAGLVPPEAPDADDLNVVAQLENRLREDFADDEEKDRTEETALTESAGFFQVTDAERQIVERLKETAGRVAEGADSKARMLLAWVRQHLAPDAGWNPERLLVFTEYKHTLDYLVRLFDAEGWGDRVLVLYGGMRATEREAIKQAFQRAPAEERTRILVATDAASEGLNLQAHCRYLVHYEIPWNPNKMEQRNGRIDRHGQKAEVVYCHHFAFEGWEDQKFLDVVVDKVQRQRADLGAVGDVIAAQIEAALRKERKTIDTPVERQKRSRDEVAAEVVTRDKIRQLRQGVGAAREAWNLYPETVRLVLDEALRLVGHSGLTPMDGADIGGRAWLLKNLPPAWSDCAPSIHDSRGRLLPLVFDDTDLREREGVVLLHLDHPLLKRALGVFRANLWSIGVHASHQLHRASYKVVADRDLAAPVIALYTRLVAVGVSGQRLHEEVLPVGGELQGQVVAPLRPDELEHRLRLPGQFTALPAEIGTSLRSLFPHHARALQTLMTESATAREKEIRAALKEQGVSEAKDVLSLIDARIKEVDRRVKDMTSRMTEYDSAMQMAFSFLADWQKDEVDQYRHDLNWLKVRRDKLQAERATEPKAVKSRYVVKGDVRAFPLGLMYLLPARLVGGVRS